MTKVRNDRDTPNRIRVPVGSGSSLHVPPSLIEDGYWYYWGIDEPGKLEQLLAAGFEFVQQNGDNLSVSAGSGSPYKHFLMRTPEEYHNEDMNRLLQSISDQSQEQISIASDEYDPSTPKGRGGEGQSIRRDLI